MIKKYSYIAALAILSAAVNVQADANINIDEFKKGCAKKYASFAGRCSFEGFKSDSCGGYENLNPEMSFLWVEEKECRYRNSASHIEVLVQSETSHETNTYEKIETVRNRDGYTSEKITQCETTIYTRMICVCAPCSESDIISE